MFKFTFFLLSSSFLGLSFIYADSPYAVHTVGTKSNGSEIGLYGYDTAGNRLTKTPSISISPPQTIEYGLIGKAVKISQDNFTSSTNHGPGGTRYLRVDNDGNGNIVKAFYLNGMDYKIDAEGNVTASIRINAKGYSPVAQVDIKGSASPEYAYFVHDHLGSPVVSVNDDGTVDKRNRYDAWGQMTEATGVANIPSDQDIKEAEKNRGYTGHELMAKFNMGQWNGRIFDYQIGAFPQSDRFIQGRSIAALNRYALGQHNNPNVTDKSGWLGDYFNNLIDLLELDPGYPSIPSNDMETSNYRNTRFILEQNNTRYVTLGNLDFDHLTKKLLTKRINGNSKRRRLDWIVLKGMEDGNFSGTITRTRGPASNNPMEMSKIKFSSDELVSYNGAINKNMKPVSGKRLFGRCVTTCHAYSLGVEGHIFGDQLWDLVRDENYFEKVDRDYIQRGDIFILNKIQGKVLDTVHSGVVQDPDGEVVKHMLGMISSRASTSTLEETINIYKADKVHFFRPKPQIMRRIP